MLGAIPPLPKIRLHGVVLRHRDNFTSLYLYTLLDTEEEKFTSYLFHVLTAANDREQLR
jgi:hypothetical protein